MDRGGTWLDKEAGTLLKSGREQHDGQAPGSKGRSRKKTLDTDIQSTPKQDHPLGGCPGCGGQGQFLALETMRQVRGLRKKPGINKQGMGKGQRLRVAAGRTWLLSSGWRGGGGVALALPIPLLRLQGRPRGPCPPLIKLLERGPLMHPLYQPYPVRPPASPGAAITLGLGPRAQSSRSSCGCLGWGSKNRQGEYHTRMHYVLHRDVCADWHAHGQTCL